MNTMLRLLSAIIPCGIVICLVLQLIISNQMTIYSNKLGYIQQRIRELEEQNDILRQRLAVQQSIHRISYEAKRLGFVEPTAYITMDANGFPIAIKK
ncbi:MAG: hypothetical protein N3A54_07180 [Patescibacteria group bacterium]|nr:hypothetical protein [Patescibacteria group bacterium]